MFTCVLVFKGSFADGYWPCGNQLVGWKGCLLPDSMTDKLPD